MSSRRVIASVAVVIIMVALAVAGERLSPPAQAPGGSGGDFRKQKCDTDAPQPLHDAAKRWCADGLFLKVTVTPSDAKNILAVMQFTPNGAQSWELQSGLLMGEFRTLTEHLAAAAPGKNINVDLHDAGDRRIGVCVRALTDASATCSTKK